MITLKYTYDFFIDTVLLQCPWPILEIKKLLNKLKNKKILIKIKNKEFLIDLKGFLKLNKKIKILYFYKKKNFLYIIIINNTEKET